MNEEHQETNEVDQEAQTDNSVVSEDETGSEEKAKTETLELPAIKSGYVVGLREDDNLHFQPIGSENGMVQLMGLHKYAEYQLNKTIDMQETYGPVLNAKQNLQIMQMLQQIAEFLQKSAEQAESKIITKF